jgi:hypothetical protein
MRKEIEEVVKDTAAVGLSAAVLGLEMGTELARKTLAEVSRSEPAAPPAPAAPPPTEQDIKVRAYQLWEQAGCPEGRDQEFYFQAEQDLRDEEKLGSTRTPAALNPYER